MATIALVDNSFDGTAAVTFTFTNQNFGAAAADRYIIVGVGIGNSSETISSVTIGGVTATSVVTGTPGGGDGQAGIFIALVPTGTTGTIVVTCTNTEDCCGIGVWRATGINPTATDTASQTTVSGDALSTSSLTIPTQGFGVGYVFWLGSAAPPSATWTNLTEQFDETITGNFAHTGAFSLTAGTPTITAQASVTLSAMPCILVAAAWQGFNEPGQFANHDAGLTFDQKRQYQALAYPIQVEVAEFDTWWNNPLSEPRNNLAEIRAAKSFVSALAGSIWTPFPIEVITADKWFNPLSERLVKTKPRATEFPAVFYGARPIVNTPDQWWQNLSTPPKAKPRVIEFPAFTYGPTPIVNTADRWWQNLATPPKAKPRATEFPAFFYGAEPIVSNVDRWWQNLATPPKIKPRAIEFQAFAYSYFTEQAENVTVDKWFEELSKPRKLAKERATEFPPFTYGARPIVNTTDQWWQNLATPPKAKPRATEFPAFTYGVPPYQAADHMEWWRPFVDPRKLTKDRSADFPFVAWTATQPQQNDQMAWWVPFRDPRKLTKDRVVEFPPYAYPPYQLTPSDFFAGWWRQLSEPYPFKKGQKTHQQQFMIYVPGAVLEEITVDKWFRELSRARKQTKDRVVQFPPFTYGALPIVSTPDRWWRNLETPPKVKPRAAWYQFTANFPIQPQNNDRLSWWVDFTQPKRNRLGLPYQLQRSVFLTQAEPFQVYRPYTMGYIIA